MCKHCAKHLVWSAFVSYYLFFCQESLSGNSLIIVKMTTWQKVRWPNPFWDFSAGLWRKDRFFFFKEPFSWHIQTLRNRANIFKNEKLGVQRDNPVGNELRNTGLAKICIQMFPKGDMKTQRNFGQPSPPKTWRLPDHTVFSLICELLQLQSS